MMSLRLTPSPSLRSQEEEDDEMDVFRTVT